MTTTPRVSIGLPVYNGAPLVDQAIRELVSQDFTDLELIISDNGSTDDTERICRAWASRDSRIRYVRQPENLGVKRNFDFVLNAACGEYFLWAAHDDGWASDYLGHMVAALDRQPEAVLATPLTVISQPGQADRTGKIRQSAGAGSRVKDYRRLLDEHLAVWIYGMYRRDWLLQYFPEYAAQNYPVWGGDMIWLASVALRFDLAGAPAATFYKPKRNSPFRPANEAAKMANWFATIYWLTRVAWTCSPAPWAKVQALRGAWRYCFREYLSRGNPVGTAVRCVKVTAMAIWFGIRALFACGARAARA